MRFATRLREPLDRARRPALALLLAALVVGAAGSSMAQEDGDAGDDGDDRPPPRLNFGLATWVAQPSGLGYTPATQLDPSDPFGNRIVDTGHGTELEALYSFGYTLPNRWGELTATYYAHADEADDRLLSPGQFVYAGTLVAPEFAGFFNDGLYDGVVHETRTTLRDLRLEWRRQAFEQDWATGSFRLGWARVSHRRLQQARYFSLVAPLPALLPPLTENVDAGLLPQVDRGSRLSDYDGRGPVVGFDMSFPVLRDLYVEAGLTGIVLRGDTSSEYRSSASYYTYAGAILADQDETINTFNQIVAGDLEPSLLNQTSEGDGLNTRSVETNGNVLEAEIGVRWKYRRWMDAYAGFRSSRYDGVGIDVRPDLVTNANPLAAPQTSTTSVTYEGFYGGVTFRIF